MGYILKVKFDLQPEILPEIIEVATILEAPKAKESRRKRKQET